MFLRSLYRRTRTIAFVLSSLLADFFRKKPLSENRAPKNLLSHAKVEQFLITWTFESQFRSDSKFLKIKYMIFEFLYFNFTFGLENIVTF